MKTKYEIIGIVKDGDRMRLLIKLYEPVQQQNFIEQMQQNPELFFEKQRIETRRDSNPESVTISMEQCQRDRPAIGGIIEVEVFIANVTFDPNELKKKL